MQYCFGIENAEVFEGLHLEKCSYFSIFLNETIRSFKGNSLFTTSLAVCLYPSPYNLKGALQHLIFNVIFGARILLLNISCH